MMSSSGSKYVFILLVLQICTQAIAKDPPRDAEQRRGMVIEILTEKEANQFGDEVNLDGVTWVKTTNKREIELEGGLYLAFLREYCQKQKPTSCFDLTVITWLSGIQTGKVVAGAKLKKLKRDEDISMGILRMENPVGLEFVMDDGKCGFVPKDSQAATYYDCRNDNYMFYGY